MSVGVVAKRVSLNLCGVEDVEAVTCMKQFQHRAPVQQAYTCNKGVLKTRVHVLRIPLMVITVHQKVRHILCSRKDYDSEAERIKLK